MSKNWKWIPAEEADEIDWMLMTEIRPSTKNNKQCAKMKVAKPEYKVKLATDMLKTNRKLRDHGHRLGSLWNENYQEKVEKTIEKLEKFLEAN